MRQIREESSRAVMGEGDHRYAVVSRGVGTSRRVATFALPPDSEPTSRLWVRLEKLLLLDAREREAWREE